MSFQEKHKRDHIKDIFWYSSQNLQIIVYDYTLSNEKESSVVWLCWIYSLMIHGYIDMWIV